MLAKTTLAVTLFFILLFISSIENKIIFVLIALISTFIADIDSKYSTLGKKKTFRILQFFTKHRGIIHSFTFVFLVTLVFVLFFPIIALPFFLGYCVHLFLDSFTIHGITPFYPLKMKYKGKITTGGKAETTIFVIFIILDVLLFFFKAYSGF